jgi:hypothetical protein
MKGNQVYSNKGPSPFQMGDNHKSAKIRVELFKYFVLMNHGTKNALIYMNAW